MSCKACATRYHCEYIPFPKPGECPECDAEAAASRLTDASVALEVRNLCNKAGWDETGVCWVDQRRPHVVKSETGRFSCAIRCDGTTVTGMFTDRERKTTSFCQPEDKEVPLCDPDEYHENHEYPEHLMSRSDPVFLIFLEFLDFCRGAVENSVEEKDHA